MSKNLTITIFCSSSDKISKKYFDATAAIAKELAHRGITIVYGGGNAGLMGCLADTALENGGKVIGVIPEFMKKWEREHTGLTEMIFTETMQQRKDLLITKGDAVIALPGGVGTMDEVFEALTLKRLQLYPKPIILFNQDGFYDPLIQQLETFAQEEFMEKEVIWESATSVENLLEKIDKISNL